MVAVKVGYVMERLCKVEDRVIVPKKLHWSLTDSKEGNFGHTVPSLIYVCVYQAETLELSRDTL